MCQWDNAEAGADPHCGLKARMSVLINVRLLLKTLHQKLPKITIFIAQTFLCKLKLLGVFCMYLRGVAVHAKYTHSYS